VVHDDGSPLTGITQLAAGGEHTCALTDTGVWCWGSNHQLEVGTPKVTCFDCATPVRVPLPAAVRELALGGNHSCALIADGAVMCWGASDRGERGDGTIATTEIPTEVGSPDRFVDGAHIATFGDFTCAITRGATATCWGGASNGEMGDGTYTDRRTPGAAVMLSGVSRLATGSEHACAIANGALACWGASYQGEAGPVGRGGYVRGNQPAMVPLAGPAAIDLGGGGAHTCALLEDHTVTCWGDGRSGQLGNGMRDRRARVAPRLPCP
jgi:alpha-tubulin suppressor-like RCC1 family protein